MLNCIAMDTQRVLHTDNSYPFNRACTKATSDCKLFTEEPLSKSQSRTSLGRTAGRQVTSNSPLLTALLAHVICRRQILIRKVSQAELALPQTLFCEFRMFFAWLDCTRTVPPPIIYRGPCDRPRMVTTGVGGVVKFYIRLA